MCVHSWVSLVLYFVVHCNCTSHLWFHSESMGHGILAPLVCTVETNKLISVLLGLCNWKYVYNMFWILRFITLAVTVCLMMFRRVCKINENSSIYVSFLIDEHGLLKEILIFFWLAVVFGCIWEWEKSWLYFTHYIYFFCSLIL